MNSIWEEAKRQDEEREIQKDEQLYKTTGKIVAYDENCDNPLVPLSPSENSSENSLTKAQRAKIKRMMDFQKKIIQERKEEAKLKAKQRQEVSKNGIRFLDV
jgi:hypothetical protein